MKLIRFAVCLALPLLGACGENRPLWHDQVLPSGKTVKVTSFNLVWGIEHDDRDPSKDCLAIEFVATNSTDEAALEQEAQEVFELIRPASDLWRLKTAEVSSFPSLDRKGRHAIFSYTRGVDGRWTWKRSSILL